MFRAETNYSHVRQDFMHYYSSQFKIISWWQLSQKLSQQDECFLASVMCGQQLVGDVSRLSCIIQMYIVNKTIVNCKHMYLGAGSVVVQSGQAGEVLFRDGWSRLGGDQTVGVCGVSNHQNLSGWDPNISVRHRVWDNFLNLLCLQQANEQLAKQSHRVSRI